MTLSGDYTETLPRKRMAAGMLIMEAAGRTLLVEPTYKDHWEIPGGCVDAGESPRAAAARELNEELGLQIQPGRLLVVDWVPPWPARTEGVIFIYSGGSLTPEGEKDIHLPADELRSWAWCTEPQADERLSELLARRLRAARQAAQRGTTYYLENGDLA